MALTKSQISSALAEKLGISKADATRFMESFAVDYTTSSLVSFMDDSQPVTTTISMSFKETQLLTKRDIDAGY